MRLDLLPNYSMNQALILFVGIRYSMRGLLSESDLNNHAWPAN